MAGEAARRLGLRGRLLIAGGLAVALMTAGSIVLVTAVDGLRDGARADRRSQQVLGASAELQKLVIEWRPARAGSSSPGPTASWPPGAPHGVR